MRESTCNYNLTCVISIETVNQENNDARICKNYYSDISSLNIYSILFIF